MNNFINCLTRNSFVFKLMLNATVLFKDDMNDMIIEGNHMNLVYIDDNNIKVVSKYRKLKEQRRNENCPWKCNVDGDRFYFA